MTLSDLHSVCVGDQRFHLSKTRERLMRNLWTLCGCLISWGIEGELWVDGSFLTEKIDPPDTDVVLLLPEGVVQSATPDQIAILDWWSSQEQKPKQLFQCDSYLFFRYPIGHPMRQHYENRDAYWRHWYGTSRAGVKKGIPRVQLPGGCR